MTAGTLVLLAMPFAGLIPGIAIFAICPARVQTLILR